MIKILEGENTFLSKKKLDSLIQGLSCKIINADSTKISTIFNEYETQDMFNSKKLLVIKRLLSNKDHREFVEAFKEKKDVDLIIWEDKKIPKNTKYYKLFQKIGTIESFNKFNKRSFLTWAIEESKNQNLNLEKPIIQDLAERTNYEPHLFINEIEKLKLTEKESFNKEDLKNNTEDLYNNSIWEFIDSINKKNNKKECTKILLNLFKNRLDPHYLMVMMARNIKQILLINKMLEQGKSDSEIISNLKILPFTLPKLKNIAQNTQYDKLLRIYEKIYNLNYETKVGNIEPELGLILLITRLD